MRQGVYILSLLFGSVGYWFLGPDTDSRISTAIALVMIMVPSSIVGWIVGQILMRQIDVDRDGAQIFVWTNLVLWLFPPLGFAASAIASTWSKVSNQNSERYLLLATVGGIAATVNCAIGAMASVANAQIAM
jgi:hypothetical protein